MADAGNPITMANMVQMGVTHAIVTGFMKDAYHEWKQILVTECTWNKWKDHINDAFNELKELNAITAEGYGYGSNIMHPKEMTQKILRQLTSLHWWLSPSTKQSKI